MQTANLLDLAADRLVIYPTEVLCLFARLTGAPQTAASQVQVWLPENLVLEEDPAGSPRQSAGQDGQGLCITWNLPAMLPAAMEWSLAVRARQEAVGALTCTAFLIDAQGNPLFERSLGVC